MNITINNGSPKEYQTRNQVLWDLTMKKPYLVSLILLLSGIIILVVGFFQPYSFASDLGSGINQYNFHFSIGFGSSLILLALLCLRAIRKNKQTFNEAISLYIQRAEAAENYESSILITSDTIKFSNFEEIIQTNWSAFISYKVIKGYVVLYKQKASASYLIDLSKMSKEDQVEFNAFLNERLIKAN